VITDSNTRKEVVKASWWASFLYGAVGAPDELGSGRGFSVALFHFVTGSFLLSNWFLSVAVGVTAIDVLSTMAWIGLVIFVFQIRRTTRAV